MLKHAYGMANIEFVEKQLIWGRLRVEGFFYMQADRTETGIYVYSWSRISCLLDAV